jgi:hypothetical protein
MRNAHQNMPATEKYCYGNNWGWYNETEQEKEEKRYAKSMSESLKAAHEIVRIREK